MIGFIGLGQMGGAIVRRLLAGGTEILAFDETADRLAEAARHGARPAGSAREIADSVSIVMTCLPSSSAAMDVGRQVAAGSKVEIYAELSTIGRHAIRELDQILRPAGVQLIDAPVSGGPAGAARGTLSLMLSGPSGATERIAETMRQVAGSVLRVGNEPGQAQLCKLVNNGISMTALAVSCEALAVGVARDIDASALVEVINAGTGRNSATTDKIPLFILPRKFNMGATLGSATKDLDLYLHEAEDAGLPAGVIAMTRELWERAVGALGGSPDASEITRYFEGFTKTEVAARPTLSPGIPAVNGDSGNPG